MGGKGWLYLALVVCLALRVPGWFTQDHKAPWQTFEPDEGQHVHVATQRFNDLYAGEKVGNYGSEPWNVRGYGHAMAYVAYGWYAVSGQVPNFTGFIKLGRQLSTLFALLLVLVVYSIGRASGLDPPVAGFGAFLLAVCDVNATYSHYCLPAVGYVLGCYLAVLGGLGLLRAAEAGGTLTAGSLPLWGPGGQSRRSTFTRTDRWRSLLQLSVGTAIALTFKFDVMPLLWGGLLLLVLTFRRRAPRLSWKYLAGGIALLGTMVFALLYGWSWENIQSTFTTLSELNRNGVPQDDHLRDNLVVYPAGVVAGIGLPVILLAVYGLYRWLGKLRGRERSGSVFGSVGWLSLFYVAGWLGSEFLVRWSVDTAFIRRVNVFMPAVCVLAAYGWAVARKGARSPVRWDWIGKGIAIYTFCFALVGQLNHWKDTRYAMREWIATELPADAVIATSNYVGHKGLRSTRYFMDVDWDYAVLHESFYRRYARSMTTPFGLPECCAEVYNCGPAGQCEQMQALLTGSDPDAYLLKSFEPLEIFPERWAYRQFFGYYETYLGATLVYAKRR